MVVEQRSVARPVAKYLLRAKMISIGVTQRESLPIQSSACDHYDAEVILELF
jgi:hypothetical protein